MVLPRQLPAHGRAQAALSPCEHQVLDLVSKGFIYDGVAALMQLSRDTLMTFLCAGCRPSWN